MIQITFSESKTLLPGLVEDAYDLLDNKSGNLDHSRDHDQYPPELRMTQTSNDIVFLVPKFHLPGHNERCQLNYSFNLTPHVGRTDGEAPERGWAAINALASSTKSRALSFNLSFFLEHFCLQIPAATQRVELRVRRFWTFHTINIILLLFLCSLDIAVCFLCTLTNNYNYFCSSVRYVPQWPITLLATTATIIFPCWLCIWTRRNFLRISTFLN